MFDPIHNEAVDTVFFSFCAVTARRGFVYCCPQTVNPRSAWRCIEEILEQGRIPPAAWRDVVWDQTWFDISLLPPGEAAPPPEIYDAFAPIAHPSTGCMMAVLLRKRPAPDKQRRS